jgi:hypothetical protein
LNIFDEVIGKFLVDLSVSIVFYVNLSLLYSIFVFSLGKSIVLRLWQPKNFYNNCEQVGRFHGSFFKHQLIIYLQDALTKSGYGTPLFSKSLYISVILTPSSIVLPVKH